MGVGLAVTMGRSVGVAASVGLGALEQANDASKPVRTSADARYFPRVNGELRTYRKRSVNRRTSYKSLRAM